MKKVIFIIAIVVISNLEFSCSKDKAIDLSTPEKTIKSYYEAFKESDFDYQKKTLERSIEAIGKETFNIIRPILQSFEILKIREAKDRKEDTFHLPEDDVQVLVKEIYKGNKESVISFVLRKFDQKWLIIGFDIAEDPPDIKLIEKQAKEMLERKGVKVDKEKKK
jgi:adenine deaminase